MHRNRTGQIRTGERVTSDATAFYVSVLSPDARDYRLVLGPFDSEPEARGHVDRVRRFVATHNYKDHHWFAYGTAGFTGPRTQAPPGMLNREMQHFT